MAINQILDSGYVLCWAAKWYGEDEVMFDSVNRSKPKSMLSRIYKLINESDAIVHYNGTKFDMPTLNKEFLMHDMLPPAPYKQIDLLQTARRQFRFPSNKLDYIAKQLGLGCKTHHKGHQLWIDCMAKQTEAWKVMEEYNKNDVVLLEKVYDKLKPWIKNHPNHNAYEGFLCCPKCGSDNYQSRGHAVTSTLKYRRFQCKACGGWFRGSNVSHFGEPKHMVSI